MKSKVVGWYTKGRGRRHKHIPLTQSSGSSWKRVKEVRVRIEARSSPTESLRGTEQKVKKDDETRFTLARARLLHSERSERAQVVDEAIEAERKVEPSPEWEKKELRMTDGRTAKLSEEPLELYHGSSDSHRILQPKYDDLSGFEEDVVNFSDKKEACIGFACSKVLMEDPYADEVTVYLHTVKTPAYYAGTLRYGGRMYVQTVPIPVISRERIVLPREKAEKLAMKYAGVGSL